MSLPRPLLLFFARIGRAATSAPVHASLPLGAGRRLPRFLFRALRLAFSLLLSLRGGSSGFAQLGLPPGFVGPLLCLVAGAFAGLDCLSHSMRCGPFPCIAFISAFQSLAVMLHVYVYVSLCAVGFRLLFIGSSPFSSPWPPPFSLISPLPPPTVALFGSLLGSLLRASWLEGGGRGHSAASRGLGARRSVTALLSPMRIIQCKQLNKIHPIWGGETPSLRNSTSVVLRAFASPLRVGWSLVRGPGGEGGASSASSTFSTFSTFSTA